MAFRFGRPSIASLLGAALFVGCSLKYEYTEPVGDDLQKLERLTEADLSVDSAAPPPGVVGQQLAVPFRHEHNQYFVDVEINGVSADLILDWGSWVTLALMPHLVIESDAALTSDTIESHTLDGRGEMRTGMVRDLRIDDLVVRDVPFAMTNRDLTVKLNGLFPVYRGKGMLRLTFFVAFNQFAIDTAHHRLYLGAMPTELSADGASEMTVTVPFRIEDGMLIESKVDGRPCQLKVDIGGFSGEIMLIDEAADRFMEDHEVQFVGHSTVFGERVRDRFAARLDHVQVGSYEKQNVTIILFPGETSTELETSTDPQKLDGVVGNRFFGETIVGVDWSKRELHFIPVQN